MLLNTRGLLDRNPEAVSALVRDDDVVVCTESWLGVLDTPPALPGYVAFHFPRLGANSRRGQQRARGGVVAYVRQSLARHTSVWRTSQFGTHGWLRVDKAAGLAADLFLAACYIPPAQRNAHAQDIADAWDTLSADIAAAQAEGQILMAGDFNARTATLQDWDHSEWVDGQHNAALLDVAVCNQEIMIVPPVSTPRCNQDSKTNQHGHKFIALCRSTDMRICNGRTPGDLQGTCTCFPLTGRGKSTVDYFLACPVLMPQVRHLSVSAPEVGFDHSAVRIQLDCMIAAGEGQQGPACEGKGPELHPGYRVVEDYIPAFAKHFSQASNGGLEATMLQSTAAATSEGDLDALGCTLDAAIHASLKAAGMPELQEKARPAKHRPNSREVDAGTRQLRQQKRRAVRHADWALVQRLNLELLRLRNQRRRQDKAEQQAALLILARADRSAFWRKWKKRLSTDCPIAAAEWRAYFAQLFGAEPPLSAAPHSTAGATQTGSDTSTAAHPDNADLNQPFTAAEVVEGIEKLRQRKSVLGFLKLEFLTPIAPVLAPILAELFNACARLGRLPHAWALGAITPLLKPGGNPCDCGSYRGITVGTLLAKLYATIINTRLVHWAEENGVRAKGQAGFRKDHRTSDQIFVLRTLIEQQRMAGTPLYVCFVDFQKAYDTVPRDQLWGKLERMGIKGFVLNAIRAMYADVPVSVKTPQGLTPTFQSLMGVKQGCPLSPTLFGLYIDDFEQVVLERTVGLFLPGLGGSPAPPLFYADDLALMSLTGEGLQRQLHILEAYADRWGLTVNIKKTKVVVFSPPRKHTKATAEAQFVYKGETLKTVDSFRYLGVELHATHPMGHAAGPLAASGLKAMHAMRRRCAELGLTSPHIQTELFDALVRPVLSYGAEIWATQFLAGATNPCDSLQGSFLRGMLGVRQSTPTQVVLAETGRFPLVTFWAKLVARFWSRLVRMDDSRLTKQAFILNVQLACRSTRPLPVTHHPWASHVVGLLTALDIPIDLQAPAPVSEAQVEKAMQGRWLAELAACEKSKVHYYVHVVRDGIGAEGYQPAAYLTAVADRPRRVRLAQLRTGSHWLRIETGRWQKLERAQRMCPNCGAAAVEDEAHMVFDCALYAGLRLQFADLFTLDDRNLALFLSQDPLRVAQFVHQCYELTA